LPRLRDAERDAPGSAHEQADNATGLVRG